MSKIQTPRDAMGNELVKDNLVVLQAPFPVVFKILAVESGGIHTANGMTPALVRIVADLTLRQMPGQPFVTLVRVVAPSEQQVLERVSDLLPNI